MKLIEEHVSKSEHTKHTHTHIYIYIYILVRLIYTILYSMTASWKEIIKASNYKD